MTLLYRFPGEDISICVCLAILISLFSDQGMLLHMPLTSVCFGYSAIRKRFLPSSFYFYWRCSTFNQRKLTLWVKDNYLYWLGIYDDGKSYQERSVTKWDMRRRLVFICQYATNARPSRGNLKQVFAFLNGGIDASTSLEAT